MKLVLIILAILFILNGLVLFFLAQCEDDWCYIFTWQKIHAADGFERCESLGFGVTKSYPRQCRAGKKLFIESVGSMAERDVYDSEKLGVRFKYPTKYFVETKELGDGHRGHLTIILTEDTEENRLVREGKSPGREGPTAITFDFYQSPEESTPIGWMKRDGASNFKLSDGTFEKITLAGKEGVSYSWDGLYEADTVVVAHQDYIVSMVVTYISPIDEIRKDFREILGQMEFR